MKVKNVEALKAEYERFIAQAHQHNVKCGVYNCPSCKKELESIIPENDDIFDSLATCPYCGEVSMKIAHSDKIVITSLDGKASQEFAVPKPYTSKNEVLEIKWTANDVIQRLKDLGDDRFITFGDACDILDIVARQYDANLGVNWDTIDDATNEYFNRDGN